MGGLRRQWWMEVPSGKGQSLIVVHAGGVKCWVDGADLVLNLRLTVLITTME